MRRLLILVGAALLPLLVLSGGVIAFFLHEQDRVMEIRAVERARGILAGVERELFNQIDVLNVMTHSPLLDQPDLEAFYGLALQFKSNLAFWDNVILSDLTGQQVVNMKSAFGKPLPQIVDPESFTSVVATASPMIGNLTGPGPLTQDGRPRISLRVPVLRDGAVRSVLSAIITTERLSEVLESGTLGPSWSPYLVDGAGRIIAAPKNPDFVGRTADARDLKSRSEHRNGIYDGSMLLGHAAVTAFATSPRLSWSVHISTPLAAYNARFFRLIWILGAATLLAAALSTAFIWLARREALERYRLAERLREQAMRDPLTGLFNRRYLEEVLPIEIAKAKAAGIDLGLIMFDLDHFKRINDTFGHEAGDNLLLALGKLLTSKVRATDIVCRPGGEEFIMILPGADLAMTEDRAVEVLRAVKDLGLHHRHRSLGSVTISAGVAALGKHGSTPQALIAAADQALYQAKAAGRDRVVTAA